MTQDFTVERIVPSKMEGHVDVHVRYDGGSAMFSFPDNYSKPTILVQIRFELRARMAQADAMKRLATLLGRHEL